MAKKILIVWLFLALSSFTNLWSLKSSNQKVSKIPGPTAYLGQTPPGDAAVVFAPGFISTGSTFVQNSAFSQDGKEFYFTKTNNQWDHFEIMSTKFKNGKWTLPAKAVFFEKKLIPADEMEPFLAPGDNRIYFSAGDAGNLDIWYCEKKGEGWDKPVRLPATVNSPDLEWYPTISKKNTLFFAKRGEIYYSTSKNGDFNNFANIGKPVNATNHDEGDPLISPNEEYVIFHSIDRADGFGQGDLYISFKKENGSWTNPKNLGPEVNTEKFEFGPSVTPDGKYFMFSRRKQWLTDTPSKIYWIKSDFIALLKHSNFVPYSNKPISDQSCVSGQPFRFTIPEDAFIDDDGNNTLTYSAVLDNGDSSPAGKKTSVSTPCIHSFVVDNDDPLPSWLGFNPVTRTFSGTPTASGTISIKIIATDTAGATAFTTFALTVADAGENSTNTAGAMVTPRLKGAYFGQSLPGETPVLFAPAILTSLSAFAGAPTFSPDGTQCFVSVGAADYSTPSTLYYSECVNNVWKPFVKAPFIADFTSSCEPVFSADGNALTFTGKKPPSASTDFWTEDYTAQGWGTPACMPSPINSDANEWRGSTMTDGTMYFGSERAKPGIYQVYKAYRDSSRKRVVEKLGLPVNMNSYEGDPCIAPDGHFLIFSSGRDGVSTDLYVSFCDGKGGWGTPINLGAAFNTGNDEYGAYLSHDGKDLFFTRHTSQGDGIYWVATSAIEKLK